MKHLSLSYHHHLISKNTTLLVYAFRKSSMFGLSMRIIVGVGVILVFEHLCSCGSVAVATPQRRNRCAWFKLAIWRLRARLLGRKQYEKQGAETEQAICDMTEVDPIESLALMKGIHRVDETARGSNGQANMRYNVGKLPAYSGSI